MLQFSYKLQIQVCKSQLLVITKEKRSNTTKYWRFNSLIPGGYWRVNYPIILAAFTEKYLYLDFI